MKYTILLLFLLFLGTILIPSCVSDKLDPVVNVLNCDSLAVKYSVELKPIIDASCAYVGCHVAGSSIGNFSTYQGLTSRLESGQIENRVLTLADMPPAYVSMEDMLTEDEFNMFSCWIESGFPE